MENNDLQNKVITAAKWSSITEVAAKLIIPVTNMILARILTPEAFGVIATVTMIVSFADMFTDSGFQKYLVQHGFKNEDEKFRNADVAFWTNFIISIFLWISIGVFREKIAAMVGNTGLGNVVAVACIQLPLTSFSSIQMAVFRRDFDFKTLFIARFISVFIPFIVTIPLALAGFGYWSLIIGTIFVQLSNAGFLTVKSKWRPKLFYSFNLLKEMLSFSIWSLMEAISIWLTTWIDAFIIGSALNQYYLGLYKTSTSMVNALMAIITGATTQVLFSALSRVQNDNKKFESIFLKFQRAVSIFVFPMGIGVYLFSDLASELLLGSQWGESSGVIGIWALTSSIMIVLGHYCSEVYRSKGKPKMSFMAQFLHLIVLVPTCIISSNYGFWALVYSRSIIRIQFIAVHLVIMNFIIKFPVRKIFKNVLPSAVSAITMGIFGYVLRQVSCGILWSVISIGLCVVFYFVTLSIFPGMRNEIKSAVHKVLPKRYLSKVKL